MILQNLFYFFGIVFFIIIIVTCVIFIRKTSQTATQIKKILSSSQIDNLVSQLRTAVQGASKRLNIF